MQSVLGKNRAADMLKLLVEYDKNYKATQAFLKQPPNDVNIYEIHPKKLLKSKVLTSGIEDLNADYKEGIKAGLFFLNNMRHHFTKLQ